jgi:hypothetical protein
VTKGRLTISIDDEDLNLIKAEAEKEEVTVSKFVVEAIKNQIAPVKNSIKSYFHWYDHKEDEKFEGSIEMFSCDGTPEAYHFLQAPNFHQEMIQKRGVFGAEWREHFTQSRIYQDTLLQHIQNTDGFICNEIYSTLILEDLAQNRGRFTGVDAETRTHALDAMIEFLESDLKEKIRPALLERDVEMSFRLFRVRHNSNYRYWGYVWGQFHYLTLEEDSLARGLLEEFRSVLARCTIVGTNNVLHFLHELKKDVK